MIYKTILTFWWRNNGTLEFRSQCHIFGWYIDIILYYIKYLSINILEVKGARSSREMLPHSPARLEIILAFAATLLFRYMFHSTNSFFFLVLYGSNGLIHRFRLVVLLWLRFVFRFLVSCWPSFCKVLSCWRYDILLIG